MTDAAHIKTTEAQAPDGASEDVSELAGIVWQMVGMGVALMVGAALLLWWHFGPVIFFDTLATLQSCF